MSARSLAHFYRQMGTLLDAGMPILRALDTLAKQGPHSLRGSARALQKRIEAGDTLSEAMLRQPRIYAPLDVNMIRAAEHSGLLHQVLLKLAESLEFFAGLRQQLFMRLLYPALVLHVAIAVHVLVGYFVHAAHEDGGSVALHRLLIDAGPLYAAVLLAWLVYRFSRRLPGTGAAIDWLLLYVPVFGRVVRHLCLARFTRAFEAMYSAGVSTPLALELAAEACGNDLIEARVKRAIPKVKEGERLSQALAASGIWDDAARSLLLTGEESGKVAEMLGKVRDIAEDAARTSIQFLGLVLPSLAYLIVVVLVVALIFSLISGYIGNISQMLGG